MSEGEDKGANGDTNDVTQLREDYKNLTSNMEDLKQMFQNLSTQLLGHKNVIQTEEPGNKANPPSITERRPRTMTGTPRGP